LKPLKLKEDALNLSLPLRKKALKTRKAASRKWIQGVLSNLDASYKRDQEYNAHLTRIQRGIDSDEE